MHHVADDDLEAFARELLEAVGTPPAGAADVADSLVTADLRGHVSHGTRRLPRYVPRIGDSLDPAAEPELVASGPTHAAVDGNRAFGQIVGRVAVDAAVERAAETGVGVVGISNTGHLGRIGEWSERAIERGMVFSAHVYNPGLTVGPPGSSQRRYSTNPISYGIPTFGALDFPFVLDVATAQVANGKTAVAKAKGEPLPAEWTITASGEPQRDAAAFREGEGALLPLGGRTAGYKGFGLAMVAELLGGIVGGGLVHGQEGVRSPRGNGAVFLALDPTRFATEEEIRGYAADLAAYVRETEFDVPVEGDSAMYGDRALLPGEAEYLTARERRAEGIPMPEGDAASLRALADEHGVAVPAGLE